MVDCEKTIAEFNALLQRFEKKLSGTNCEYAEGKYVSMGQCPVYMAVDELFNEFKHFGIINGQNNTDSIERGKCLMKADNKSLDKFYYESFEPFLKRTAYSSPKCFKCCRKQIEPNSQVSPSYIV
jgi:hypothetical protein